ncbi:MAG: asparagine synthase (glutamine-hydrolyzing) [Polyangiales bacterium]
MCGIAGVVLPDASRDDLRAAVTKMCSLLVHRGPDEGGCYVGPPAAIGMRRLSIVDIQNGHQPMVGRDGDVILVFNGEIYNAPEIRAELEAEGVAFSTRSDTEVILRLYERNPEDVERRLRGMWAFCILDQKRRRLVLSRDRFGIKPLFLLRAGRTLAFASELRAFHVLRGNADVDHALRLSPSAAHAMLSWGFVPNERTIHEGVTRLPPATRFEISLEGGVESTVRHWQPTPSKDAERASTIEEAEEIVSAVLRESVAIHLRSDVPCATFLSGGIDSSLVSAYAARAADYPVRAFAIGFTEPRFDESPYAREVARKLGLEIDVATLRPEDGPDLALEALQAYDEPFGDSSAVATYALSRLAARTHRVVLGGDGGDEGFAGYRKHRMIGVRDRLGDTPRLRSFLSRAIGVFPAPVDRSTRWSTMLRQLARVGRSIAGSDAQAYRALTQVEPLDRTAPYAASPGGEEMERALERHFERALGTQLQRSLVTDTLNTLPNDLLTKVDRASMRFSLEVRVPFLDHLVFETGLGLRQSLTLGRKGKAVLRALAARDVGHEVANRPKHGFEVPVEGWLRGPLQPICDELFTRAALNRHGLLSTAALADGRWRQALVTDPLIVWNALALAAWCATLGDTSRETQMSAFTTRFAWSS